MPLYFQYMPKRNEDGTTATDNPFYYWYLFMREIDGYSPDHPLAYDFSDVRREWTDWWNAFGWSIFDDVVEAIKVVETPEQLAEANKDDDLIIRVKRGQPRSYLMLWFKIIIDDEANGFHLTKGRRKHNQEVGAAKYSLHQRPDISALAAMYNCWMYRKENPEATLYEIGVACDVAGKNIIADSEKDEYVIRDKKNIVSAAVSRYLRKAERLIVNVEKGKFPCYD